MYRYFLKSGSDPEREVTKQDFVAAERVAGLINTMGQPDEPATAGFSGWIDGKRKVAGRVEWHSGEEVQER